MLRSVVMRHSMSYAAPHPTGCTWLKPSPAAKQMLGKPAVSLVLQPQQRHGPERVHMQSVRCMASSRGNDDKSWSELASMPQASSLLLFAAIRHFLQHILLLTKFCHWDASQFLLKRPDILSPGPVSASLPATASCSTDTVEDSSADSLLSQVRQLELPKVLWASSGRPSATL